MSQTVVLLGLVPPVAYAILRLGVLRREDYLYLSGRTPFLQRQASITCGNIGIGAIVALFVLTAASPVIGLVVVFSYCAGLVLCGLLAPRIHAAACATGSYGLIDWLVSAHGVSRVAPVWLPVAVVFGLRTVVRLQAPTLILDVTFPLSPMALVLATLVVGSHTAIGGYRVATETGLPQTLLILFGMGRWRWS